MEVVFENKYKIATSGDMNLVLEEYVEATNSKTKEKHMIWRHCGFYGKLSSALSGLMEKKIKDSTVKDINSLRGLLHDCLTAFSDTEKYFKEVENEHTK